MIIESPVVVTLDGIILLSYDDGVPVNFIVDTNDGSGWTQGAKITGNTAVLQFIKFPRSLRCLQLRVNVTLVQKAVAGEFTRIAELSPVYADLSSSVPTITTTPSPTTTTTIAPSTISTQSENTITIVSGVLGAVAGVSILALIVVVLLMRRRGNKNGGSTPLIDKHHHHPGPPSSSEGAKILIPPSSSYAPDELTTGSGAPVTSPPPSSLSYPPGHYSNMGSTAFNTSASPQSHSLSMATTTPTPIHPSLSSSYPGPIFGTPVDNRRPTEVSGTNFVIELPEGQAREGQ